MARVFCLDVNREGDQLVTVATPSIGTQSSVVWLSTATGNRTSVEITADFVWSVAFNPKKTELFISDIDDPVRILSMGVTESGRLDASGTWKEVSNFSTGDSNIASAVFDSSSFLPDESCLYFADGDYNQVWAIDPRSASATATLVGGSGKSWSVDGDGPNAVATPDGCNVFVTGQGRGLLRWLKLDAPCSKATSVQDVARYSAGGLSGLALRQAGSELSLHIGASDGSVFELIINNSRLHSCAPTPPPVDPPFFPPSWDMPSSSGPSPSGSSPVPPSSRGTNLGLKVGVPVSISAFLALATCLTLASQTNLAGSSPALHRKFQQDIPHREQWSVRRCVLGLDRRSGFGHQGDDGGSDGGKEKHVPGRSEHVEQTPSCQGGSLYARLHHREKAVPGRPFLPPLTLVERMCIAWHIARGLSYLHGGVEPPVIHRDIKSSNVLLGDGAGEKLRIVLADFGLATIGERVFGDTAVKTFGYMAPEYVMSGILSEKIDVYAFGVILLELLTGRKAATEAPSGNGSWQTLADWARSFLRSEFIAGGGMPHAVLDSCCSYDDSLTNRKLAFNAAYPEDAGRCTTLNSADNPEEARELVTTMREGGEIVGVKGGESSEKRHAEVIVVFARGDSLRDHAINLDDVVASPRSTEEKDVEAEGRDGTPGRRMGVNRDSKTGGLEETESVDWEGMVVEGDAGSDLAEG
ncbi:hypothetical protein CBR_g54513 [Chara braunii]|uniref:Protein kinase domain-containing protein n=1 Tax=Chara braunii TaxID=69332 RepID=A0A388MC74_CHABU|nr:hypothetical protein CBR_g54513 [Chara braunii]|eukprot:GBG92161.1 hypothetical protein CBR_g54513 [Chara braunii]